jgi:predicted DNA-binding transcriptional regulator AlpA
MNATATVPDLGSLDLLGAIAASAKQSRMTADPDPHGPLLDMHQLAALFRVSRRTIWRWVKDGILPPPLAITRRIRLWRRSDIEAIIERAAQ